MLFSLFKPCPHLYLCFWHRRGDRVGSGQSGVYIQMCRGQRSVVEQPDQTTQSLHAPPAADPQSHNSAEEQMVFLPHCVMSFGGSLLVFLCICSQQSAACLTYLQKSRLLLISRVFLSRLQVVSFPPLYIWAAVEMQTSSWWQRGAVSYCEMKEHSQSILTECVSVVRTLEKTVPGSGWAGKTPAHVFIIRQRRSGGYCRATFTACLWKDTEASSGSMHAVRSQKSSGGFTQKKTMTVLNVHNYKSSGVSDFHNWLWVVLKHRK